MRQPRWLRAWEIMRWLAPESRDVGAVKMNIENPPWING